MATTRAASFLALLLGLSFAPSLDAHHGSAIYDTKHTLTLIGTVTELTLANPHSTIALDVKNEQGGVTHWVVEFGVLRELKQQGWADDTLKPGDEIKVPIHPKKDGSTEGMVVKVITYADGRALTLNPPKDQQGPVHILHW